MTDTRSGGRIEFAQTADNFASILIVLQPALRTTLEEIAKLHDAAPGHCPRPRTRPLIRAQGQTLQFEMNAAPDLVAMPP